MAVWRALADVVLLAHAAFIVFVIFGALPGLWRRRLIWWHLPALLWGIVVAALGLICPLTPLENLLRQLGGQQGYPGGFLEHYLLLAIYPPGLTHGVQMLLAAALAIGNGVVYAVVFLRR
ncbi:MAG: DUF2784 domain-containing protein [Candidimonas sp.]|nr:MAG: DUF2784 domain-containing protein [Candidimonas sp.]